MKPVVRIMLGVCCAVAAWLPSVVMATHQARRSIVDKLGTHVSATSVDGLRIALRTGRG
jgi:hypothetical protein